MPIVATIKVAILGAAGAQDNRRRATSMMGFPLSTATTGSAVRPSQNLSAALALSTSSIKGDLNLGRGELVDDRHESLRPSSDFNTETLPSHFVCSA